MCNMNIYKTKYHIICTVVPYFLGVINRIITKILYILTIYNQLRQLIILRIGQFDVGHISVNDTHLIAF